MSENVLPDVLDVNLVKPLFSTTAFGELKVESMTPITQITAQYGLLTNVLTTLDNASSGTASVVDNKFTCDSGVASDGLSSILTLRQLGYKAGQGAAARFTTLFDTPVADNIQASGMITAENSFAFGYIGTAFGVIHSHSGKDELQELTLTVAGGAENATVTIDAIAYVVALSGVGDVQGDAFEISESLNSQVPNYSFTSNNDQVVAQAVLPVVTGSFAYTSAGSSVGSWSQLVSGLPATVEFTPQASWNGDVMADLDQTKGNVYQIQLQYLGFGAIDFFIENPVSGDFVLVHRIEYANNHTTPSVTNPTFRIGWLSNNTGNTSTVRVQGSSAGAFVEGIVSRDVPARGAFNEQISVGTTLTNIISVRNRISFGEKVNRADLFPLLVSASSQTNKVAFFAVILNPVYASPVTFEYYDKNSSISEVTTGDVEVSGGTLIGAITVVAGSSQTITFNQNDVTPILPGDTFCVAAQMSSGSASDCQATMTWQDDL
jgi:hypothetical protein